MGAKVVQKALGYQILRLLQEKELLYLFFNFETRVGVLEKGDLN